MKSEKKSFWNAQQKKLQSIVRGRGSHEEIVKLLKSQHLMTHSRSVSNGRMWSFHDEVLGNLSDAAFRTIPLKTKNSIAWHVWHTTRIEDITMNMLVKNEDQTLYRRHWHTRLNIPYVDTGNSMTAHDIRFLSLKIDYGALSGYRNDVGTKTQRIISGLGPDDLKRRIDRNLLHRVISEKAVDRGSAWLIDFWGRKTIAGLLLMPATRHNFVHLNKSMEIKNRVTKDGNGPPTDEGGGL